jgi:DDT domain/WSTF, HB1, Itc1p, MBD9 motif 1
MSSVGSLLETWNTLNVYCQVFLLDSFTFDDFVEAMEFSSTQVDCELFNEIHCAVLKKLVNGDDDQNGAIQISLPDLPSDDEDEDDSDVDGSSAIPTPTPEPEEPVKRTTRSSLNKALAKPPTRSPSAAVDVKIHRAAEMFDEYGWIQRLRKRDFRKGGWQLIMVGLLHQLAGRPRLQADCDQILAHLAPLDAEPTQQTAWLKYSSMDVNIRVKALQIICMLTLETKAIKTFLEESSAQMTELRKTKIEHQRARKEA